MLIGASPDVAQLLRSLPDRQPPPDAWQRIRARHTRRRPALLWPGLALAASVLVAAVVLFTRAEAPAPQPAPTVLADASGPVYEAPAGAAVNAAASVTDLQRRSRHMERLLHGLPERRAVMRSDYAAALADIHDRLAAVDYQINQRADRRAATPVEPAVARWAGASRRVPVAVPERQLWQQRVNLMDRLVRVRYAEAGASAY